MDCYRNVASSKSDNHNLILNCKHMIDQSWWWLSLIVFTSESEVIRFKSSSIKEAGITMGYSFLPSFLYLSLILYTPCSERSLLCFWCNLSYFYGQIHSVFLRFFFAYSDLILQILLFAQVSLHPLCATTLKPLLAPVWMFPIVRLGLSCLAKCFNIIAGRVTKYRHHCQLWYSVHLGSTHVDIQYVLSSMLLLQRCNRPLCWIYQLGKERVLSG